MGIDKAKSLSAAAIVQYLHRVVNGEIEVRFANPGGPRTGLGNEAFLLGEWRFTFFYDGGDVDYIDEATFNGRAGDFDSWHDEIGCCPLDLLSQRDRDALEHILKQAK